MVTGEEFPSAHEEHGLVEIRRLPADPIEGHVSLVIGRARRSQGSAALEGLGVRRPDRSDRWRYDADGETEEDT